LVNGLSRFADQSAKMPQFPFFKYKTQLEIKSKECGFLLSNYSREKIILDGNRQDGTEKK